MNTEKEIKIFFISSFDDNYKEVLNSVERAIGFIEADKSNDQRLILIKVGDFDVSTASTQTLQHVQSSDIIISNLSSVSPASMYDIGISHALEKPTIILVNNEFQIPVDLSRFKYITYDRDTLKSNAIVKKISNAIQESIAHPENWIHSDDLKQDIESTKKVFVSYSHKDTSYLDRLKVHLKPLERKGAIQLWSDTLIQSGDKWEKEIERALENTAIAILLISADFLASDFIINNELQPLLKNAEDKGTIIIPVVLKPCRFLREPSISQFQSINDPSLPLCKLNEFEKEEIYEGLSQRIEIALESE